MRSSPGERIVITGIGLTAPNGNSLDEFRKNLLGGVSGVKEMEHRHIGKVPAGICNFDALRYQSKKDIRTGTRAGSVAIYCSNEAVKDSGYNFTDAAKSRIGVYLGITEHGNVETENEVFNLSQYDNNIKFWTHYHNPRSIANNPAGETTINMGITGPHYCIGAACAAGNAGIIQGAQQLMLGEVDMALAGGVSESIHTFGIFASFKSQGALASHEDPAKASRPMDKDRNGIVVSEGGCVMVLERLSDARKRGAKIYGELVSWHINSDATNAVLPSAVRQTECVRETLRKAGLEPGDISIINTHATGTKMGDAEECAAIRAVFAEAGGAPLVNNTKGFIGHAMGAAGALELAGNIPSFFDGVVHPCMNLDNLDPECEIPGIVAKTPVRKDNVRLILNNSFGMLGINSALIVGRPD